MFANRMGLGDPLFVNSAIELEAQLLDREHAKTLKERISLSSTLPQPTDYQDLVPLQQNPNDSGTSHFSVVDKHGNAVAMTSTVCAQRQASTLETFVLAFILIDGMNVTGEHVLRLQVCHQVEWHHHEQRDGRLLAARLAQWIWHSAFRGQFHRYTHSSPSLIVFVWLDERGLHSDSATRINVQRRARDRSHQ